MNYEERIKLKFEQKNHERFMEFLDGFIVKIKEYN